MKRSPLHIDRRFYRQIYIVAMLVLLPNVLSGQGRDNIVTLSKSEMSEREGLIYITDTWLFQAGDNTKWATSAYPDTSWQRVSTYLGSSELSFIDWKGIGWFRFHFKVDSTLVNHPLGIILNQHNGASEIYLDGELLYELGEVSAFEEEYRPYRAQAPLPLVFPDTSTHLLSVRYANHDVTAFDGSRTTPGFRFLIGDLVDALETGAQQRASMPWWQLFFNGGLVAFTIIHLLIFVFYPAEKKNLYFALFTFFLAGVTYTLLESNFSNSPVMAITYHRLSLVTWLLTVVYALRFTYSLISQETPKQFWVFLGVGLILAAGSWSSTSLFSFYREVFVLITIAEITRVLLKLFWKREQASFIIGIGLAGFAGGILYTVGSNLGFMEGSPVLGNIVGSSALILSMSVYLSRDFAQTQLRLEEKLEEVQRLSEKSLRQERLNKKKELQRKLLEAENERKSQELEKARALQLSMLPKQIPQTDHWDVAVFMETAQEVGGDYYDFNVSKNGTLTVAVGDATGHGMKAGIMVATAKSYFHTLANNHDNLGILRRMSSGIRNMDLRMMYMGLLLIKCDEHTVHITSAGMPPCLHYDVDRKKVNEVLLKGMPLGSRVEYPYKEEQLQLKEGEVLVLMSDGLMELFNEQREQLGLQRIKHTISESATSSASDILTQITKLIDQWSGTYDQEDDITVLVMKAK